MGEGRKVKLSERTADRLCELIMDERQFTPGASSRMKTNSVRRCTSPHHAPGGHLFLVAQGVLEIRRGKGTFVTEDLPAARWI